MMDINTEKKPGVKKYNFSFTKGGEVKISIFEGLTMKALIGVSNGKGIAVYNNIVTEADLKKEIKGIKEIKWLKKGEQYSIIEVLKTIKF